MTRSTLAIVLSLTAVFICGALVGGFGYHAWMGDRPPAETSRVQPRRNDPGDMRRRFIATMKKHLDLSEAQISELNAILDRTEKRSRDLDAKSRPEKQAIMERQVAEINAMLSADQQEAYARLLERVAEDRRKSRGNGERKPPPGE